MSLLDKSIELYLGVKAAKPMNDPMFLQMKDFIVNHFGHEGTRAIAVADEQDIVFTYKNQPATGSTRRTMRAFEHPLNVAKRTAAVDDTPEQSTPNADDKAAAKLQSQYEAVGVKIGKLKPGEHDKARKLLDDAIAIRVKINALKSTDPQITPKSTTTGNVNQSPELAAKAAKDAKKQANAGKQNSPAHSQAKTTPDVAAGDATPGDTTDNATPVEVDIAVAKTMRAKALGELYPADVMQRFLHTNNVALNGKESRTQLAALILVTINPATV